MPKKISKDLNKKLFFAAILSSLSYSFLIHTKILKPGPYNRFIGVLSFNTYPFSSLNSSLAELPKDLTKHLSIKIYYISGLVKETTVPAFFRRGNSPHRVRIFVRRSISAGLHRLEVEDFSIVKNFFCKEKNFFIDDFGLGSLLVDDQVDRFSFTSTLNGGTEFYEYKCR